MNCTPIAIQAVLDRYAGYIRYFSKMNGYYNSDMEVQSADKEFWYSLDRHLSEKEFQDKVDNDRGYVILENNKPIGLLRYNLFWDNTPFCTMLFADFEYQKQGYGKKLIEHWEKDMKSKGYGMVLTSTRVDERSQHFYRNLGYKDCGGLIIDIPGYEQPMELFLSKSI